MRAPGSGGRIAALALAWLAGVASQLHERELLPQGAYVGACAGAVLLFVVAWTCRHALWRGTALAVIGAALAGFSLTGWQASERLRDALRPELEGRDLVVTGVVASLPQAGPGGLRFQFAIDAEARSGAGAGLPQRIALGWYSGFHEDAALTQPQRELRAGQRWRFTVRAAAPAARQPQSEWLRLRAAPLRAGPARHRLRSRRTAAGSARPTGAGYPVERLRQRVRDAIYAKVADRNAAGVLAALAVGDQSAIERSDWDLFRNTGVAHLMSISGLHVTMFAWLAGLLVGALWRRSARHAFSSCGERGALGRLRGGGGLCLLLRLGRALAANGLDAGDRDLAARRSALRWPWLLVLLASAVVVTGLDPWALTQAGFWLIVCGGRPAHGVVARARSAGLSARPPPAGLARLGRGARSHHARRSAHPGHRHHRPGAAHAGVLPAGLGRRLSRQPRRHSGGDPRRHAAGATRHLRRAACGPSARPWFRPSTPCSQRWRRFRARSGSCRQRRSGPRSPAASAPPRSIVMPLPWRAPRVRPGALALALLLPPRELPAEGSFDLYVAAWSRPGHGRAGANVRGARPALRCRTAVFARKRCRPARARAAAALARRREHVDLLMLSHRDLDHVGGAMSVLAVRWKVDALSKLALRGRPSDPRRGEAVGQPLQLPAMALDLGRCRLPAVLRPCHSSTTTDRPLKSKSADVVLCCGSRACVRRSALLAGDIEGATRRSAARPPRRATRCSERRAGVVPRIRTVAAPRRLRAPSSRPCSRRSPIFQAGYRNRSGHPAPARRGALPQPWRGHRRRSPCLRRLQQSACPPARPRRARCERDLRASLLALHRNGRRRLAGIVARTLLPLYPTEAFEWLQLGFLTRCGARAVRSASTTAGYDQLCSASHAAAGDAGARAAR